MCSCSRLKCYHLPSPSCLARTDRPSSVHAEGDAAISFDHPCVMVQASLDSSLCVVDVGMVCDYVKFVHARGRGRVGCGVVKLFVGLCECGVESECESCGCKRASHGDSAVRCVGLCVCVVEAAVVGGLGGDPWSQPPPCRPKGTWICPAILLL